MAYFIMRANSGRLIKLIYLLIFVYHQTSPISIESFVEIQLSFNIQITSSHFHYQINIMWTKVNYVVINKLNQFDSWNDVY